MRYNVSVSWVMTCDAEIEAESKEHAELIAEDTGLDQFSEPLYLPDSFLVDAVELIEENENWQHHN